MTTGTFGPVTAGNVSFTNITVTEIDTGSVAPFLQAGGGFGGTLSGRVFGLQDQLLWQGQSSGAIGPNSSMKLTMSYNVADSDPTKALTSIGQLFTYDAAPSSFASVIVDETVFDANGDLVGELITNIANPTAPPLVVSGDMALNAGYSNLHVNVTVTASVAAGAPAGTRATFSVIEQGFTPTSVSTLGSISGIAFLDNNADGTDKTPDAGIGGVNVALVNTATNAVVETAMTAGDGSYKFSNLFAGSYKVVFTTPAGDLISPVGTSSTFPNSIVTPAGQTGTIVLAAGQNVTNQNAGYYAPATFNVHVYSDANDDFSQDNGEPNLSGVSVTLKDGGGNTVTSGQTDGSGNISFTGLVPGAYQVSVTTPAGDTVTQQVNVGQVNTLASGGTASAIEGLFVPASLSGHVFLDANADGVQQAGDLNQQGITVQLLDSSGNPIAGKTALTDSNGFYQFTGLVAGSYEVQVGAPAGDSFSPVGTNANPALDSIVNGAGKTSPAAVVAGADTPNQNAGLYAPATFNVHVYSDANDDFSQDNGEPNLSGVSVTLKDGGGNTVTSGQTDGSGNISFTGLVPGAYQVSVTTPAGDTVTQQVNVGQVNTLASGGTASAIEGLFVPASLSGHVFLDANADGVQQAGDLNQQGITVQLLDSSGNPIAGKTALTDSNGFYQFTGLVAGSYEVQVGAPAGDSFSPVGTNANPALDSIVNGTGKTSPAAVVAGADTPNQNAGLYAPATFNVHVYSDANDDFSQDNGEPNLSGVSVTLKDGGGNTVTSGQTDGSGNISFTGLVPGAYQVSVTTPAGDTVTQQVNVGQVNTLASGGTASAIEGLFVPASLSGHVFLDANADGVQQAGDLNQQGITVQLLDSSGNPIAGKTALTDSNGFYQFTGLVAGSYEVQVGAPAGDSFSPVGTNANPALDSIVNGAGKTSPAAVVAGADTPNQNAGLYAPATFNVHVYSDANDDFSQDNGEPNLSGVSVTLKDGGGNTVTSGQTDGSGNISFTGLVPGAYQVSVTTPAGDTVTQQVNVGQVNTLASGGTASAIEGLFVPASLSGHVFLDANADGVQQAGDLNQQGITVQLLDSSGNPIAGKTALTDSNGFYQFTGLVAGSYEVQVGAPAGDSFSPVGTNANPALDSIVNGAGKTSPAAVLAGADTPNQNAGLYAPATFNVHVYSDANDDFSQDNGEPNLSGVSVTLKDGGGNTVTSGQTDGSGNISFTGLVPGAYQVSVTTPAGDTVTQQVNVGQVNTLASGGTASAIEGLFVPASLSGHVFLDANADGVQQAGDLNQQGITVQLLDSSGNPIAGKTALTDSNGFYQFTGLVAGSYEVQVGAPAGDSFSPVGTNANPALDSIVNGAGKTSPAAVVAGADTPNQNAGLYAPATFNVHVYSDANDDFSQDNGEPNLSGVSVTLKDGGGNTVTSGQTDGSGNISFTGLVPGAYQVSVTTPAGDTVTQQVNVGQVNTLASGGTASAIEGLFVPASLSGHVFLDANADGVQQAGDLNQQGITVQLLDSSGNPIAGKTALTDSNGFYQFTGLVAGSYEVQVGAPAGDSFSPVGTNANPALDSIVNGAGKTSPAAVVAGADTPNQNAGLYAPAEFDVHVYYDTNDNNAQNTGEANLSGLTVTLKDGNGTTVGSGPTNGSGNVAFTGLKPGSYQVSVATPAGDIITQKTNVGQVNTLTSGQVATATEGVVAPSITIDNQVSFDGSTWKDMTNGNLENPTTTVGHSVYYRSIVTNTGTTPLSGVGLTDGGGETLGVTTLTAGQTVTSSVVTTTAASGHRFDTATVTGTASGGGATATVSSSDVADYSAIAANPPGISITKSASVATAAPGAPVTYTYKVTNTGGVPITNVNLVDDDATPGVATDDFHPTYVSGDANNNHILDTGEVWNYTATVVPPVQTYSFSGTPTCDGAVNGYATFTLGNGYIVVSLTNTTQNTHGEGQEITGLTLNLNDCLTGWASLSSASGKLITLGAGGSVTQVGGSVDQWGAFSWGSMISLTSLLSCNVDQGIIGSAGSNGKYSYADSSIYGHLPDIQGTGTFIIAAPGVTAATKITSVSFGFGTSWCDTLCGTPSNTVDTNTVTVTGVANTTTLTATATASVVIGGSPSNPLSIDKQISVDGCTWYEVGVGNTTDEPSTFVGKTVYERVIVTNNGTSAVTGASVSDTGAGPSMFRFGGNGTFSLAAGGKVTSDVATFCATDGEQADTATVTGTSGGKTYTASDSADYKGLTACVAIDDQVSFDGTVWYDQKPGVLQNQTTLAGGPVYYRSIVTNTGSAPLSGVSLNDTNHETLGVTTLTAGQTVTSSVATLTAVSGHQYDTASVTGTASATNQTATVSASDIADYSAVKPSIVVDDQVSLNGTTWYDQSAGVLQNPSTGVGSPVYYRAIVTNTGPMTETGVKLTDTNGETLGVTTLTAGQTVTSSVVTLTAASGHQYDTASVVGTVTANGKTSTVSASDIADYTGVAATPGIKVTKTANVSSAAPGAPVTYTYKVTNTGGVAVTGLTIKDDNATPSISTDDFAPSYASGDANSNNKLDAGETWTYKATVQPPVQKWSFSGTPTSDGAVNGYATITVENGYIIVALTNNTTNTKADGQEITSFSLKLGNNAGSTSLTNATGQLISIGNGGTVTPVNGTIDHWNATASGSTITLNSLIGGKPNDGIIGPTGSNGLYSSANSSIYQHLPDIQGTGTFVIAAAGVTSATDISSVTFGFGTSSGQNLSGSVSPIVDTNTVSVTGSAGGTTVSGTATASVTVGASAPSNCTDLYTSCGGKANQIAFQYNPGNSVCTLDQDRIAGCTGSKSGSSAFIVMTDKAGDYDNSATTFCAGNVNSGGSLLADASSIGGFSNNAGSMLFAHVFSSQAAYNAHSAALQEIKYDVSGGCNIALDDTVGCLKLTGYASTNGQGYFC